MRKLALFRFGDCHNVYGRKKTTLSARNCFLNFVHLADKFWSSHDNTGPYMLYYLALVYIRKDAGMGDIQLPSNVLILVMLIVVIMFSEIRYFMSPTQPP